MYAGRMSCSGQVVAAKEMAMILGYCSRWALNELEVVILLEAEKRYDWSMLLLGICFRRPWRLVATHPTDSMNRNSTDRNLRNHVFYPQNRLSADLR